MDTPTLTADDAPARTDDHDARPGTPWTARIWTHARLARRIAGPRRFAVVSLCAAALGGLVATSHAREGNQPTLGDHGSPEVAAMMARAVRTVRVSVSSRGVQANASSSTPVISADGRFVAFSSDASSLVRGDTNGVRDVFVRDQQTDRTQRVSVSSSGAQANAASSPGALDLVGGPAISWDGRYVAFASAASNLVRGDTNGKEDVFVRDTKAHTTERVSVATGGAQANGDSLQPSISADGRYVAFVSAASNLACGATGAAMNVFVRDLRRRSTRCVSVSPSGAAGNGPAFRPSISADGRLVAFESFATNLVGGDTNGNVDVFVRDLNAHRTRLVSVSSTGVRGNAGSYTGVGLSISRNDRLIVFYSLASNLAPGDTNGSFDVFLRDLNNNHTVRVSQNSNGAQGNNDSFLPSISANGRSIAFESTATNLAPGDTNATDDIFIRDQHLHVTERLPHTSGGTLAPGSYEHADLSADGGFVTFASAAANLLTGDTNGVEDVFRHGPLQP
jgi:Tol biopolymer transport system component